MKKTVALFAVTVFILGFSGVLHPKEYAVVSKSLDDENFKDTVTGCNEAAVPNGDRCIHIGAGGPADARKQAAALGDAARSGKFSGFAISVVMSNSVARVVRREVGVPVISFDSPFSPEDAPVSNAYVGTDNLAFGRDLARTAKRFHPGGGTLFLMGGLHDSNLSRRIAGIRRELSGRDDFPAKQRLTGENGWWEFPRSPWVSGDDVDRAIAQVSLMLKTIKPDVFISVGHWPVVRPGAYRKAVAPYATALKDRRHVIICGVGKISPDIDALLADGLIHGLVSIDFFDIGREVYHTLHALVRNEPVPVRTIIPNIIRMAD